MNANCSGSNVHFIYIDCLALDFQINNEETDKSKWNAFNGFSLVTSAWHCQMKCVEDFECHWFSWKHDDIGSEGTHGFS